MANAGIRVKLPVLQSGFGRTLRTDAWWVGPGITFAVLTLFVVYATFRMFENAHYTIGPYLSPFYSPLIDTSWSKGWPIPVSGAMIILAGPGSFRFTCYYYRKAYYRAFAMDPPACAVGERSHDYNGERKLLVVAFLFFLWHDAIKGLIGWTDGVHLNVGTLMLTLNAFLLSGYTLSCHAFRHFVGGNVNSYSTATLGGLRHMLWKGVSRLNTNHMAWAWTSLFGVMGADLYVRLVSNGTISDMRFF
jgi:hypothetical protein